MSTGKPRVDQADHSDSGRLNTVAMVDILRYSAHPISTDNRNEMRMLYPTDKPDDDLSNIFVPGNIINCLYGISFLQTS